MITLLLAVVLSVVNAGQDWKVQFSPHPLNVGVQIYTSCYNKSDKLVYVVSAYIQVEPEQGDATVHRTTTGIPSGSNCEARFDVMRNADGALADSQKDYSGESATITWTEK